ncbi:MAG: hypothetical protein ACKODG_15600 [Betaproteobacteria bacterium]
MSAVNVAIHAAHFERLSMKSLLRALLGAVLVGLSGCSDTVEPLVEHRYPTGMPAETALGDPDRTLGSSGNYNYPLCSARYERVISAALVTNGALPDVRQSQSRFVGIDGAFFAMQFGKSSDRIWDVATEPSRLQATLEATCSGSSAWSSILAKLGGTSNRFDRNQCANATYINTMLYGGNGLFRDSRTPTTARSVSSNDQTGNTVLTWTRGYLLQRYGAAGCADCANRQYHAVIDAGSSGTRLSLFEVAYQSGGYPTVKWLTTHKGTDNGIDNFVATANPAEVNSKVIDTLFNALRTDYFGQTQWPATAQSITVDPLATAGMREAELKHGKAAVDAVYQSINNYIAAGSINQTSPAAVSITYTPGRIATIDGNSEEGLWTWINLNDYFCDVFQATPARRLECANETSGRFGVIEVGGASMQVSFPVAGAADPASNRYAVNIGGKAITVYNKTFLGLGQDLARRSMAAP